MAKGISAKSHAAGAAKQTASKPITRASTNATKSLPTSSPAPAIVLEYVKPKPCKVFRKTKSVATRVKHIPTALR